MTSDEPAQEPARASRRAVSRRLATPPDDGGRRGFGLARRIAFVCLHFMHEGLSEQEAIDLAAGLYVGQRGLTRSYFRKCKSEARAMVDAVLAHDALQAPCPSPADFVRHIERELRATSLKEVTRRRAGVLQGTKGGPPPRRQMPVLRAVEDLQRRAARGDPLAAEELRAVCTHLVGRSDAGGD